jgi:opacity protein-like surface antigen
MHKHLALLAILLFASTASRAQGPVNPVPREPVAELFGGYAYTRFNDGGVSTNGNGVVGSFAWNFRPWIQLVADSSYNHASLTGTTAVLYGNHYGARVFYKERNKWRLSPFAELLVGGSHVNNTAGTLQLTDTAFSLKAGGGVDYNLTPHFAIRAFDADYYRTALFGGHQNNLWVSAGLVVRFGGARPE